MQSLNETVGIFRLADLPIPVLKSEVN